MLPPLLRSAYTPHPVQSSKKWPLLSLLGLLISGCTIQGPERVLYLKENEVVVQRDDTLSSIAARHNVSVKDLAACNQLVAPYRLNGIQKLALPSPDGKVPSYKTPSTSPKLVSNPEAVQWTDVDEVGELGQESENKTDMRKSGEPTQPVLMADSDTHLDEEELESSLIDEDTDKKAEPHRGWGAKPALSEKSSEKKSSASVVSEKKPIKSGKCARFISPVSKVKITKTFKQNQATSAFQGVSLHAEKGTPIYACADGTVILSGKMKTEPGSKTVVLITHPDSWSSCYKKLDRSCVSNKQKVRQGDVIGYSQGPEVVFELRDQRAAVDPVKHMDKVAKEKSKN